MNIGINASFLRKPHTGIGQVTTHFLHALAQQSVADKSLKNHKFFIYCEEPTDVELPKNFYKKDFLPRYKRDDLFRKLLWEKFYLPRKARRDKCDVLISLYQSATVIKYTDMQHVMVVHDIIPRIFPEYLDNLRKKIYWSQVEKGIYAAHKVATVSEYSKKDLEVRLNVKANKASIATIAVDPIFAQEVSEEEMDRVMKKYNLTAGKYIYTGGGLEMRKATDRTLRAYRMLTEKMENVPPLVVSGKLMPELAPLIVDVEQIVRDLGIVDRVKILGFVEQEDLPALYKGAKMFVYPSLYEGFGMPVLESMSMNTPVITTGDTSVREVGGDTVMYVDHDDDQLCDAMMTLITDTELHQSLCEKAKERSTQFSWDDFVKSVFSTFMS